MTSIIRRRVDALERAQHPAGQCVVDGVMMGLPEMIAHFRRLAIEEQRCDPAKSAQRRAETIQRAEARRSPSSVA